MMVAQLPILTPLSLREQVVETLRAAITDCVFEPGGRLTERALCEQLGVGRSTIREGLRQLEAEGLVRITPHRGPVVTVLSETEATEFYGIRAILEAGASAEAARRITPDAVKILRRQLQLMKVARDQGDFAGLQRAKTPFYATLFAATGNEQLALLLKQLRARVTLVRGLDVDRVRRMDESVRGAEEILKAVEARDAEAARKASANHIERAAELALKAMRQVRDERAASARRRVRVGTSTRQAATS